MNHGLVVDDPGGLQLAACSDGLSSSATWQRMVSTPPASRLDGGARTGPDGVS